MTQKPKFKIGDAVMVVCHFNGDKLASHKRRAAIVEKIQKFPRGGSSTWVGKWIVSASSGADRYLQPEDHFEAINVRARLITGAAPAA
jgi:hypothetical protein